MVAEASETENNYESVRIVMNNEEEADLSLSSVIFSAGMIVWSIVEKISLSLFLALTYPYTLFVYYPICLHFVTTNYYFYHYYLSFLTLLYHYYCLVFI